MPGIAGIVSKRPTAECQSLVKSMTNSMEYESFYNSGMYSVPELGICASWVAQEGSFGAGQPFFNERTDVVLLFSGECFADPETRTALQQKRHQVGQASGDWLVHLYEEEGDGFFEKLNGLFSGLLIDKRQRKAFLFNDRYGVERIYWHESEDGFYFASEAKALLHALPELRAFDEEGVTQFLTFGCTLEQRTLFRGINILPGADGGKARLLHVCRSHGRNSGCSAGCPGRKGLWFGAPDFAHRPGFFLRLRVSCGPDRLHHRRLFRDFRRS